jgi:UDP-N-acetylmuramate-alanine ligase
MGVVRDGDLLLTLGAGDIGAAAVALPEAMSKLAKLRARS